MVECKTGSTQHSLGLNPAADKLGNLGQFTHLL